MPVKSYSLGKRDRRDYVIAIVALAVLSANGASYLARTFMGYDLPAPFFGWPEYAAILFAGYYFVFDKYLWRLPPISLWTKIPNLNGVWVGTIDRTEFPSGSVEVGLPIMVLIEQTFTKMSLELKNPIVSSQSGSTHSKTNNVDLEGELGDECMLSQSFTLSASVAGSDGMQSERKLFGINNVNVSQIDKRLVMEGSYVSSFPRTGQMRLERVSDRRSLVEAKIGKFKDSNGDEYLAVPVPTKLTKSWSRKLQRKLSRQHFTRLRDKRHARDGSAFHITIVSPMELKELSADQIGLVEGESGNSLLGALGRAARGDAETYYIIVESAFGAFLRSRAGLPPKDFHVTLGFYPNDVHGISKDASTAL